MRDTRVPTHLLHPLTGDPITPIGHRRDGREIWPILGGSEPPGGAPGAGGNPPPPASRTDGGPTDPNDPLWFPPNTAVAEMTDRQAANYWRNQSKVQQGRLPANLTELQQKAKEYDELVASTRTEAEVAVDEALEVGREEGRAEVRMEAAAEILSGVLEHRGKSAEDITNLMRGINPAGFLTADGKIDRQAIAGFADALAPAGEGGGGGGRPDLGQGRRGGTGKPSVASGRDLFQQRHPQRTSAGAGSTT
jgi:hypothetical protein